MAPKTELVFRALVGGSTGAGVVTTLGLAVWSSSNASWAISNFALSALALMGVSSIGVVQSLLKKRAIQCACLGTIFNLPMTKITLFEDLLMVAMAGFALIKV